MITKSTFSFLEQLSLHNHKEWMDTHRNDYEDAKLEFQQFVQQLIDQISIFDPSIGETLVKQSIFRLNRDIRFAKEKLPYKQNFGAFIAFNGRKSGNAGYYFHLQPNNKSFVGGGIWNPEAIKLKQVRQEIDYNLSDFQSIISDPNFKKTFGALQGDQLVNAPKGYEIDNPAIPFLKFKSFTFSKPLTDKEIMSKDFLTNTVQIFETLYPFIKFLNTNLETKD